MQNQNTPIMSEFKGIKKSASLLLFMSLLLGMTFSTSKAFAESSQKIGVVDYGRIFQMMPETKAADQSLQAMKNQSSTELAKLQSAFQNAVQAYQRGGKPNATKEKELRAQQENLQKTAMEKQRLLAQKEQALITPIRQKIDAAVAMIAQKDGYSMIFDKSARVYGNDQSDITYKVLDELKIK